jgi:hypothetical protein
MNRQLFDIFVGKNHKDLKKNVLPMCCICFNAIQPFEMDFECVMKMGLSLSIYKQGLTKVIILL